jgi:hypothetical protein
VARFTAVPANLLQITTARESPDPYGSPTEYGHQLRETAARSSYYIRRANERGGLPTPYGPLLSAVTPAQVLDQARKDLGENAKGLPEMPERGSLDIAQVLDTEYAFA